MVEWRKLVQAAWGALYPDRCELCLRIGRPAICNDCRAEMVPLAQPIIYYFEGNPLDLSASVFPFEGRAAQAVKRLKYSRATSLAGPMASMLRSACDDLTIPEFDIVVPVPIHWRRRCDRGFNQSELICEGFSPFSVETKALKRIRATRPQVGLTRAQRLNNLKGAFAASPVADGRRVLLVDDVFTSGGTATACAEALKQAGAIHVTSLTFCGERQGYTSGTISP